MNTNKYVVRIVKPENNPSLPQKDPIPRAQISKKKTLPGKTLSFLTGSCLGIAAGLAVYLMLRSAGAEIGGVETSFIIGLPSALGILTSFATH